jgi:hypothetical protein
MSQTPQQEFGHRGQSKPLRYEVSNRITGKILTFKTGAGASRAMDRIDNAYGAVICTRRAIWAEPA